MPCLKYLYLVFPCNEFNGSKIANGLLNEYNRSKTLSFNEKGAEEKVREMYMNEEIVLDASDFQSVEYFVQ